MKILPLVLHQTYDIGDRIPLSNEDTHHCLHVLRLKPGERLIASDGSHWIYEGALVVDGAGLALLVDRREPVEAPSVRLHLHVSPVSKPAAEDLLRRVAELGVSELHWTRMARSQKHWQYENVEGRFGKIVREAVKSSGRGCFPKLHAPVTFDSAMQHFPSGLHLFGSLEDKTVTDWPRLLTEREGTSDVHLWIGPEGDFAPVEREMLSQRNAVPIRLGVHVYRVEVAALIAMVLIQHTLRTL